MTRQPSQAELILKDYVPIFQRGEMVEGAGGRHSIKAQIESLDVRLEENLDWNLGEHALLQDLVLEIRKVLIAAKMEKENLKQLKAQLEGATQDMKAKYEAAVVEMKKECSQDGERSWQDIVEICKQIEGGMPEEWKVRKCLQSVIEVVPLYVDALAIHDNRLWKYSSATSLDDVEVGEAVEDEKLGKGVVAGVVPMTGVVGITWSEEGLKERRYRFHKKPFEEALFKYTSMKGVKVSVGPIKKLYRIIEKMMLRHGNAVECAAIMDVVRASLICDSNRVMCELLEALAKDESFEICNVKNGYLGHKEGDWTDVKLIVCLKPTSEDKQDWHGKKHKCEIQIYHKGMNTARTTLGGHHVYNKCRSLSEAIKAMEIADDEVDRWEINTLEIMRKGDVTQLQRMGRVIALNESLGASTLQWLQGGNLDFLDAYPNIPLEDYKNDGNFWHINKNYPGLRAISKNPWIFLVPKLLPQDRCKALMMKAGRHMVQSKSYDLSGHLVVKSDRTSWDVRIPSAEASDTQKIFSNVLKMPVSHFEPPKLVRYRKGEQFKPHNDAIQIGDKANKNGGLFCSTPYGNRVVTLFVYLNTAKRGGETTFPNCNLKVAPQAGMGVIHFPAYLNTSTYKGPAPGTPIKVGMKAKDTDGRIGTVTSVSSEGCANPGMVTKDTDTVSLEAVDLQVGTIERPAKELTVLENMHGELDERVLHAGVPARDEKFLLSQWCWPGPFNVDAHPHMSSETKPLNDGIVL